MTYLLTRPGYQKLLDVNDSASQVALRAHLNHGWEKVTVYPTHALAEATEARRRAA
jgi:hypothetical protein